EQCQHLLNTDVKVVGALPITLQLNQQYHFEGMLKNNPKFGEQFDVIVAKKMKKATKDALVQYLSSDLFSGIGKKTAEQLVEQLGENLVEEVLLNIELLDEVQMKGWTSKKAERFYDQLVEHSGSEQTLVFLTENGLSMNQARSVYQVFGVETIGQIRANPYVMIEKVPRIGFGIADRIAFSLGMTPLDERRLLAGIQTTIQEFCQQNGHTYMVKPEIIAEVFRILQLDSRATSEVEEQLVQLQQQKRLVPLGEDEYVLPLFMQAERTIAQQLLEINQREITVPDSLDVVHFIHQCEQRLGIQYAEQQKQAIVQALQVPISILTGGPGTGKTTVIQGLIDAMCQSYEIKPDLDEYEQSTDFPIVLLAPTGKAAKRMKAATGYEAMTIHRFLRYDLHTNKFHFNDENPLDDVEFVIVDETSMLDIWVLQSLLKALPNLQHLIFVGDSDQLPSVGPGNVLADLIASQQFVTNQLTTIFRQADGSKIIDLAQAVRTGHVSPEFFQKANDYSFIERPTQQLAQVIGQIVVNAVNKGYNPLDIQVLAPIYKGLAGINTLNEQLQTLLNPATETKQELVFGTTTFREGDKVLQLKNLPDLNIYNGDVGVIDAIVKVHGKEPYLLLNVDGEAIEYPSEHFDKLQLAYCISVHKSQGSEFPIIIMPLSQSYHMMLYRKLLYTGMTRAKRSLILCGDPQALTQAVLNYSDKPRRTLLAELLMHKSEKNIPEGEFELLELGEYDMENVSPFDFMEVEI
ncbi:MAG: SF1B family DNA helicase RecD2, partial [Culicoidibacterales bacterium]